MKPSINLLAAMAVGAILNISLPFTFATAGDRPQSVMLNVPYTNQAPLGEWSDPRQADGCEEASVVMAMAWARGAAIPKEEARRDIVNLSEFERVMFGFYQDTSIQDTARLITEYYQYPNIFVKENVTSEDIKQELAAGRLVIVSLDTRLTGLRVYRYGPVRHTVVALGYDDVSNTIIVDDPALGKFLHIPAPALDKAMWNYSSGIHLPLPARSTAFISVGK